MRQMQGGSGRGGAMSFGKSKAKLLGFASLINRSENKSLKIKSKPIISQLNIKVPVFKKKNIPYTLKKIPITTPGSRFLKWLD